MARLSTNHATNHASLGSDPLGPLGDTVSGTVSATNHASLGSDPLGPLGEAVWTSVKLGEAVWTSVKLREAPRREF